MPISYFMNLTVISIFKIKGNADIKQIIIWIICVLKALMFLSLPEISYIKMWIL